MTPDFPYIPASSLPFWTSRAAPGCVSNSMMARKMPFIIFTSRANNKPSRLFHIPHPQPDHLQVILLLSLLLVLSLSSLSCYGLLLLFVRFIFPCFIAPLFIYRAYIHTPSHSGTLAEKPYIFIDFIGYNKSHTQHQQLHLLPLTVVECVGLAHTLFRWVAWGARDLYTFITSPELHHSPQQIHSLKS